MQYSKWAAIVLLGGEVSAEPADGFLVTSIIHPSYKLAPYPKDLISVDGESRMPIYNHRMTVRQLTDIVIFLQSRYTVLREPARFAYH